MNDMKTTTDKKLPRARVAYAVSEGGDITDYLGEYNVRETMKECEDECQVYESVVPVAIIPCSTTAQARALVKFFRMGEAERVWVMSKIGQHYGVTKYSSDSFARAVLNLITGSK